MPAPLSGIIGGNKNAGLRVEMKRLIFALIALALFMALCAPCPAQDQMRRGSIKIHIQKLHSDKGQLIVSLFNSPQGFPGKRDKAYMKIISGTIVNSAADVAFRDVPYGVYAVGVLHDENSNGRMDKKYIFIPAEGVGCSRDAKSVIGPPKFKDAQFEVNSPAIEISLNMNYL